MTFFRTDDQAALNSLLKAARETLDHYRDAAELADVNHAPLFRDIAQQRRHFIQRLEDAVRESGDLPAVPDPDKEAGEMLINHVAALLKPSYAADLIEQRIEGEKNLSNQIAQEKATEFTTQHGNLLHDFTLHIAETIARLQTAHTQLPAEEE